MSSHSASLEMMSASTVRNLLDQVLRTDDDLEAFVIDRFPAIGRDFASAMSRTRRVSLLFQHVGHTNVLMRLREHDERVFQQALLRLGADTSHPSVSIGAAYVPNAPKATWVDRPELTKVLRLFDEATTGLAPLKVLLHGIGGVGKSALAAQVAAARQDRFSGGIIEIRLVKRLLEEVLSDLFEALTGLRPQEGTEREWVQQVRALLKGRPPVLLLLDDTRLTESPWNDPSSMNALLEAVASTTILMTSRSRQAPTGFAAIEVLSLTEPLAIQMVSGLYVQKDLLVTEEEAGELAGLLGGLPFALERAVELMQTDQLTSSSLLLRLHAEGRDPERLLGKLLDWSDEALDNEARLVLVAMGQLAEAPVPESLLDGLLPGVDRAKGVTRLIRSNLLQRNEKSPGVFAYQQHTLLWEWATQLGNEKYPDKVATIRQRMDECLRSHNPRIAPLLLEHILTAQRLAEERELPEEVISLALDFDQSLATFGHWTVRRELLERALRAARTSMNRTRLADVLNRRGVVAAMQGDYATASAHYQESLAIRHEVGDRMGHAWSLNNLGEIARLQGQFDTARKLLSDSLGIMKDLRDRAGIATVQGNLGNVVREQGYFSTARKLYEESLAIRQELGDRAGTAYVLSKLGTVARRQGDMNEARRLHEESLAISRELGDRSGIAWTLNNLGALTRTQGQYDRAREFYEESLAITNAMGDRLGTASALMNLGTVAQQQGNYTDSRSRHEESLGLMRELGDRSGIASNLLGLGVVARLQGRYAAARKLYEESLSISTELGKRDDIAMLLGNLGNVAQCEGDYDQAMDCYSQSLNIRRELGDRAGIARTLNNLGELARMRGYYENARQHYEESLRIRREINDREGIASTLLNLGGLTAFQKNHEEAKLLLVEAKLLAEALSPCNKILAKVNFELGSLALLHGQSVEARRLLDSSLAMLKSMEDPFLQEVQQLRATLDAPK